MRVYQFRHIRPGLVATHSSWAPPGRHVGTAARARGYHRGILRRFVALLLLALCAGAPPALGAGDAGVRGPALVEVIAELGVQPAARRGYGRAGARGIARAALEAVGREQQRVARRILASVPGSEIRWRYGIVLAGLAVVVPRQELDRLADTPGVARVYPSIRYHALADDGPAEIGAPVLWGPDLSNAGRGMKIGIIDDGIDVEHPYFDDAGLVMPAGFPKGSAGFTSAKVIVARTFPPAGADWPNATRPFDPVESFHGTHVAGIAAGRHGTLVPASFGNPKTTISGVAPLAYLGNYRALTIPTDSVGLNGDSPELVAAIEAAVADGMDVINLSLGEPEIEPSLDAVAHAIDNAAAAGVVPVVAAGNDYQLLGRGSVSSPGTAAGAITVAATARSESSVSAERIATFSGSGPTPFELALKPDVSAPGVEILSAQPGTAFDYLSGTSMAAPHVAGAAALLLERHPDWTVEQLKSALVQTANAVGLGASADREAASTRQGGGIVDLPDAADPLLFASPQGLSFGLLDVRTGTASAERTVSLADAGGGGGAWHVSVVEQEAADGAALEAPSEVGVPGSFTATATAGAEAREGERTGFVLLERDGERRRIPFWFRVTRPEVPELPARLLPGPGVYKADTRGGPASVTTYRYPDHPAVTGAATLLGPERAFRLELQAPAANLGVALVASNPGVRVQPRLLRGADENRLAGAAGLPYVANPYLPTFLAPSRTVAALLPLAGPYTLVFDTPRPGQAGAFTFRVWIDDTTPPAVTLVSRVARGDRLLARVRDAGAGVDPAGIFYRIDNGALLDGALRGNRAVLDVSHVSRGRHRLELRVSDRQESKNNENLAELLPNTRILHATIRVP